MFCLKFSQILHAINSTITKSTFSSGIDRTGIKAKSGNGMLHNCIQF